MLNKTLTKNFVSKNCGSRSGKSGNKEVPNFLQLGFFRAAAWAATFSKGLRPLLRVE